MKNFIQPGSVITVHNTPVAAKSGDLIVIDHLAGVAITDAEVGDNLPIKTEGVFYLPKISTDTVGIGQRLSYIEEHKRLTTNLKAGVIVAVADKIATNGQTHVAAKLLTTVLDAHV